MTGISGKRVILLVLCSIALAWSGTAAAQQGYGEYDCGQTSADEYEFTVYRDVDYLGKGVAGDPKGDWYLPTAQGAELLPTIVLLHGGGLTEGDKSDMACMAEFYAASGYSVLNINYTLVDDDQGPWTPKFPRPVQDVRAAVQVMRWVATYWPHLHLDPNAIALVGASAGGVLAYGAGLAQGSNAPPELNADPITAFAGISPEVQAIVSLAGAANFELLVDHDNWLIGIQYSMLAWRYTNVPPWFRDRDGWFPHSPHTYADADDPAILIVHGTADVPMEYGDAVADYAQFQSLGLDVEAIWLPGAGHVNWGGLENGSAAAPMVQVLSFLDARL